MKAQFQKQDLADMCQVSLRTVQRWTNDLGLPHMRIGYRRVIYDRKGTKKWLIDNYYALRMPITRDQLIERLR